MNKLPAHLLFMLVVVIVLTSTRMLWTNTKLEYLLAFAGIIFTGIPHGAMDHLTASYLHGPEFPLFRYVLYYLLSAFLYLLVWYFFPGIAFLSFLTFTAWHFGETDFHCFGKQRPSALLVFSYGFSLLMWFLLGNAEEILQWTELITGSSRTAVVVITALSGIPHLLWFIISASLLLFIVHRDQQLFKAAILFLCFVGIAAHTSLLLGFVVYFAGWHSMRALLHLRQSVFKSAGLFKMIRNTLPALSGALLLLAVILYLGESSWLENNGIPSLFILLAILTLPHMAQMHQLYQFRTRSRKSH